MLKSNPLSSVFAFSLLLLACGESGSSGSSSTSSSTSSSSAEASSSSTGGMSGEGGAGGSAGSSGSAGEGGTGGAGGGMGGAGGAGGMGGAGGGMGGSGGGGVSLKGGVVVGVNTPPNQLYLTAAWLHVTMKVDGVTTKEEVLGTGLPDFITVPREYSFEDLADGANVSILFETDDGNGFGIRSQAASTKIEAGRTSLLRVTLGASCYPGCGPGLTCNWGRCLDPYVPPDVLEDYYADWTKYSWCKPKGATITPTLEIGQGQSSWAPLQDMDIVDVYAGDQGGNHVYLAVRARGFTQSATVKVTGEFTDPVATAGPFTALRVFADNPAAGACESLGVLTRIDLAAPVFTLLGKTMNVNVEVSDASGTKLTASRSIVMSTEIIGP